MRIKRTDKGFTVRQKADRKIHFAGQGKRYTENTAFSPKEKQDALRQGNLSGGRRHGQEYGSTDGGGGEIYPDTTQTYGQDYGNQSEGAGSNFTVPGNIHVKQPWPSGYQETVFQDNHLPASRQPRQYQTQHQVQPHSTSAFHENTAVASTFRRQPLCQIKTKETVIHRKQETPSIKRHTGNSLLRGKNISSKEMQRRPFRSRKIRNGRRVAESENAKTAGSSMVSQVNDAAGAIPSGSPAQSFYEKRERQISGYKKGKYLKSRKQESQHQEIYRKPDVDVTTGTLKTEEKYHQKIPSTQIQQTAGEQAPPLPEMQNNLHTHQEKDATHFRRRDSGDSIRQRGKEIPGRRQRDKEEIKDTGRDSGKSKSTKENKKHGNHGKNTKKDTVHKSGAEGRRKRAAALRLLFYAGDRFSQEEQKDSLLKVAKDLFLGKARSAVTGTLLSIGASLLPILIPAFILTIIITILFNSPFSILLPKLTDGSGVVDVLAEYTEDFREAVQEELADPGSGDETELLYEDYEGDGEPDNMADILMVYMVRHGFGDTATVMTQKNKRLLKDTFDGMTSLRISYRTEAREQSYEEEDFWGNVTVKTEEVEVRVKEVRITLLTSEDIIGTGIFTEEEAEILRFLMSPEVLGNMEGLTGGYGSPGAGSLTPEEAERLNLGGDTGSQAVKNALARLGKPYSQAKRDSGVYYDCSSLTYYSYKEAGISLSYHGSNTAAAQGQLLTDRGCEVDYEDIQPGDLIFYSFTRNGRYQNISHVAVYAGNGYLVDASSSKGCVVFRPVYSVGKIVLCGRPSWL